MALVDYLAARRSEIETQIKALKAELSEIRIAEAALGGAHTGKTVVPSASGPSVVREGSIKDWVLKVLSYSGDVGLETDEIIFGVKQLDGPDVPRSSMTPQLSRLKAAGLLVQDGRNWRLSAKVPSQNGEAPAPQPDFSYAFGSSGEGENSDEAI